MSGGSVKEYPVSPTKAAPTRVMQPQTKAQKNITTETIIKATLGVPLADHS